MDMIDSAKGDWEQAAAAQTRADESQADEVSAEGTWQYANSFNSSNWSATSSGAKVVRRRLWQRTVRQHVKDVEQAAIDAAAAVQTAGIAGGFS